MRPSRLTFTAIGSYAGQVEIDFDRLAPYGLFHIHGPTGAGKSSLLDAMCFALYGEVAKPRTAEKLRSDHAKGAVEAIAALEFSSQGEDYKIIRKPAQMRPKKRGEGQTVQYRTATLLRRNGDAWSPISDNVDEVNAKMHDLVGLNADQFMQVVVLPQGLFAEALRANATRREELLRTLFQTVRFGDYTDILKVKSETARTNYDNAQRGLQRDLDQLTALSHGLGLVSEGSEFDSTAVVVAAHHMLATQRKALAELQAQQKVLNAKHELALKAAEHWQRKHGATRQLEVLGERREEILELEAEITAADAANPLLGKLELLDAARKADETARETLLSSWDATKWRTRDPESLSIEELESAQQELRAKEDELAVKRESVIKRADLKSRYEKHCSDAAALETVVEHSQAKLASIASDLETVEAAIEELRSKGVSTEALSKKLAEADTAYGALQQLKIQQAKLLDARSLLLEKEQTALDARAAHLALLEKRMLSMAGELASQLKDGDPCTVCGAIDHPHLADTSGVVDAGAIDAAESAVTASSRALDPLRASAEAIQAAVAQLTAQSGPLLDLEDPRAFVADLKAKVAEAEKEVQLLGQAIAHQKGLRTMQATLSEDLQRNKQSLAACAASRDGLQADLSAFVDQYGEIDIESVDSEQRELRQSVLALTNLTNARDRAAASAEALVKAEQELRTSLVSSLFKTVDEVRERVRSADHMQALRSEVQQWRSAFTAATQTLADPAVSAVSEAPDLDQTRASLEALNAETSTHLASVLRLEPTVLQITELSANVGSEMESLAPLREEQERLTVLWQLCNGTQSNALRMSLERYVLAAFLEEVATAATLRLQAMSSGRYRLRHSDAKIKGNGASGLTLLISDAYTGNEREVNTLSGGETFLASLALALGLADVVQSHAGGVSIDALFIDEGFGSLDPDTLELAMAELDRLRAGGRLVGIISHVETLRERIPVGIEVIKGPEGSSVKLIGVEELSSAS